MLVYQRVTTSEIWYNIMKQPQGCDAGDANKYFKNILLKYICSYTHMHLYV